MTDYEEEQTNELEALESIYPDSFEVSSENPKSFSIQVVSEECDSFDVQIDPLSVTIQFSYPPNYPDEAPIFNIIEVDGLKNDSDEDRILNLINEEIEENMGMVMVFTIVSSLQEFLNTMKDEIIESIKEEKERKEREEKEAEDRKCQGTRVTVASFMIWKAQFDEEMRKKDIIASAAVKKSKKMTGKEIFESKAIITDDSELLDGEIAVEVDESLFEDMDDLELSDLET